MAKIKNTTALFDAAIASQHADDYDSKDILSLPIMRPLDVIEAEIKRLSQNIVASFYNVGKCLIEAKQQLTVHGEWTDWCEKNTNISERDAQRFMKIANAFPNPTALSDLGSSKAYALATLPSKKREVILEKAHDVGGVKKNIHEMSTRELESVVRKYKNRKKDETIPAKASGKTTKIVQISKPVEVKSRKEFHTQFGFLTSCLDGIFEFVAMHKEEPEMCNDIFTAIRNLCENTMKKIPVKIKVILPDTE
jgi:hypothetical protein